MANDLLNIFALSSEFGSLMAMLGFVFCILVLGEYLHLKWKVEVELSRKIVHVAVGSLCLFAPFTFTNHWYVFASNLFFLLFLIYTKRHRFLSSVHKKEEDKSIGVFLFPIVIYLNYLLYAHYNFNPLFILPMLLVTFSDPAAFLGGYILRRNRKTALGSIFFFVSAFFLAFALFSFCQYESPLFRMVLSLAIAFVGALVEFVSKRGFDNITVPLVVAILQIVFYENLIHYASN